jgi:hypothetical protein
MPGFYGGLLLHSIVNIEINENIKGFIFSAALVGEINKPV